jgi:YVTN family beta-propeller protein
VGKRPRGIHASPDGKSIYIALSGTPIEAPPEIDANGNPVFKRDKGDDDEEDKADKSADGIGVLDVATGRITRRIKVGSDPEEFDLSRDGRQLYVSNEDVKTASSVDVADGKVEHIVVLSQEPEGVALAPDGKHLWVTCETGGDVFVVDTATFKVSGHVKVGQRPRSVAFLQGGKLAVVPSETAGTLSVIDTTTLGITRTVTLPKGNRPMRVRVSPDASRLYVSTGRPSDDVSIVDLATHKEIARVKAGSSPWGVAVVPTP